MKILGERFGVRTNKTLRRVNPTKKMEELDGMINTHCVKQTKINKLYKGKALVETNEHFEHVKKNKKRQLREEEKYEDSIEEEKSPQEFSDSEEETINEYNQMGVHSELDRLKELEKKLAKSDLTDEEEFEYN